MKTISVGLVGITGYAGMELARLLAGHPQMRLTMACSRAEAGQRLGAYYPFLERLPGADVVISSFDPQEAASRCQVVFLAVPAGTAMDMAEALLRAGVKVVDLSADFRLRDAATYAAWYKREHICADLLHKAVYGLPELYGADIARTSLVANPGCYPTAVILGLYAAVKNGLIQSDDIVVDAKSGATGAGRKAAVPTLFAEVSDNFRAYGLPTHRHTPEIEQEISILAGKEVRLSFNTHLLPTNRGILATIYTKLQDPHLDLDAVRAVYAETWSRSPWVRVLPKGALPETRYVRGSMFCDLGLVVDPRTGRLIILSAIDNLCRGASGQALANANLMCGLPVDAGLENLAPLP
ncbi:N-acetyl-gamma-glutamyl-phosphate reductase [Desulfovibrio legallii]|jgi:N-acetyl-gamma-glutamyl-phosphate reductase|uniref:N-acetyl-gamma-glutamyl-phosphate reductase n=1 Tax=Desulfovibrio legallii TaxID=571438 RepID=A0A1G7JL34_9BACT|nr:N-acetyl-gamma-glutamyl-phosphate reductase [Desulfovibrio legallii]SDF25658.1 N-acetyl-gamma-glutamyl-phosphate reductase [Desulfovibrio legallii]